MANVLQLVQQATGEMGLAVPQQVVGNPSQDVVQLLALTNAMGYELQREHQWEWITKEYVFTTVFYEYTGTLTEGSTTISSLSSTTGITTNPTYFSLSGTGINQATSLVSVDTGTSSAEMSQAATADGTAITIVFAQTKYPKPSDYDRQIDRTHFDKSKHWEMLGPESAQQWQWLKSSYISTGPRIRYRILSNLFQVWPLPSTNDVLGFEYVSNLWVLASTDDVPTKTSFTVDTDTCVYPDRLMVLGLKSKYFRAKGFEDIYYGDYQSELSKAKADDAGSATLSMAPRMSSVLIGWENIPDSQYGS